MIFARKEAIMFYHQIGTFLLSAKMYKAGRQAGRQSVSQSVSQSVENSIK